MVFGLIDKPIIIVLLDMNFLLVVISNRNQPLDLEYSLSTHVSPLGWKHELTVVLIANVSVQYYWLEENLNLLSWWGEFRFSELVGVFV